MSPFECSYCCLSTVTVVWDQMEETSARGLTAPTLTLKIEKEAYVNRGASLLYWSNLFPHWKKLHHGFTHWLCVSLLFLKVKGKRRKVINLWWISYIWDQFLNQLWVRNKTYFVQNKLKQIPDVFLILWKYHSGKKHSPLD